MKLDIRKVGYLPWKFGNFKSNFKRWIKIQKYKKQRIREGVSDYDAADLDNYIISILIMAFTKLKGFNNSYPSDMLPEDWSNYLQVIIDELQLADTNNYRNQYEKMFEKACADRHCGSITDIDFIGIGKKYQQENLENVKECKHHLQNAFDLIVSRFTDFWD